MREKTFKARNFFDGGIFDSKIIQSLGGKGDTKKLRSEKFQDFLKIFGKKFEAKKCPRKWSIFTELKFVA
jgi:hypothetical protein